MKITLLTTGTRGDTQPYIALGVEFKKLGHSVKLAGFENYRQLVEHHHLEFHPIKGDLEKVMKEMADASIESDGPLKFFTSFKKMKPIIKDKQLGMQRDLFEACEGADAIIYHPGAAIGHFAGAHFGVPTVLATPFPMAATKEYPALIFYRTRWGRVTNFLSHKAFEFGFWRTVKGSIADFWKDRFGTLPSNFKNPYNEFGRGEHASIVSLSPHVFPVSHTHTKCYGYWFLEEDMKEWEPPRELVAFIEEGPPPIYHLYRVWQYLGRESRANHRTSLRSTKKLRATRNCEPTS
ncbi:glycosyltransferase [Fictibacillus phosphorivorans]|uniref:glycosyltransferase n=1 Tax=Fictibacillus phosphorivorans TaxID=1221500 RepID=UPI001293E656|nr:glycosyltransferase [Fictibacillus phosphorivorans]MQR94451.1 glycosyltransferase [Fictibacillus phosphorivorans]